MGRGSGTGRWDGTKEPRKTTRRDASRTGAGPGLPDPVALEVFKNLFGSVAEEMGAALRRTAHSPNIRDRLDFSCAVFDRHGRMVAQAAHIPVHLGSMGFAVSQVLERVGLATRGTWVLNDPYAGGTHLPDVTLVSPVASPAGRTVFYVASRAHHADVGGASGGSMGVHSDIFAEGIRIPALELVSERGEWNQTLLALLRTNVRDAETFQGDLFAQFAANRAGGRRLGEFMARHGVRRMVAYAQRLQEYSSERMRRLLARFPRGTYTGEDWIEDDGRGSGPIRIRVRLQVGAGRILVDFTGTDPQVQGPVNATLPVTWSCVQYVFRTLTDPDIPNNRGCFEPIRLHAPPGTVVNASPPAAVAAGNVETSQRIVDCLYRALAKALPARIPAGSCGTMNNVSVSGLDPGSGTPFTYYETIGGGMGAGPGRHGLSGVHTHMTNTRNTPIEVLEHTYPLKVERYALRRGSGGKGRFKGGDGLVREIRFLADAQVHLLGDRRIQGPFGLVGGSPGRPGRDLLVRDGRRTRVPSKGSFTALPGDLLVVETPGGGGWGRPDGRSTGLRGRRSGSLEGR